MISSLSSKLGDGQFTMSVNHLYHLDKNLKDCYQYDFDWSLLPDSLRKVSLLLLIPFAVISLQLITECVVTSSLFFFSDVQPLCRSLKAAGYFYSFRTYCAVIVLYGTCLCQCPERLLERASYHMDCFRYNYRYSFIFTRKVNLS